MDREGLCNRIGYKFKDEGLLEKALTHSSYVKDHGMPQEASNERLEFLGDAVLEAVISRILYERLSSQGEGALTKYRSLVVRGSSLAGIARQLRIGDELVLGNGEERTGGRERSSNLENAMEAVIAAVFLDGGYEAVRELIIRNFSESIDEALNGELEEDHKSVFQEQMQKNGPVKIKYELLGEEGPDHDKTFYVRVTVNGREFGRGSGRSKKIAEQRAAAQAQRMLEGSREGETDVF